MGDSRFLQGLLNPAVLPFLIGFIAVVGGLAIAAAQKLMRHRERMAMIERGIHPDLSDDTAAEQ